MKSTCLGILVAVVAHCAAPTAHAETAAEILEATGVKGGLVVHVDCGDGTLTAELGSGKAFLVHGLDTDTGKVEAARKHILSKGLHGRVSIEKWTGDRLPYADNLVNLLVAEDLEKLPKDEVLRVLTPNGVAYALNRKSAIENRKSQKPWPKEMGEWSHFLHEADGNAVSGDLIVGPPARVQWMDGPLWARHHDTVPSINALVSAKGRVFYMVDDAPACIGGEIPDAWSLAARDAFNGVLLWKRPVSNWGWKMWSGTWKARFNQPNNVPKHIVAVGDRLYATLGFNGPVAALDAATGKIVKTYERTEFTDEIVYHNDTLILSVNHEAQMPGTVAQKPPVKKSVLALNPDTGEILWQTGSYVGTSSKTGSVERVSHLLLAARGEGVYIADTEAIVAIDLKTGKERWKAQRPEHKRYTSRYEHLMSDLCTLVATDDVVLFAQLEPIQKRIGWGVIKTGLYCYAVKDGQKLWSRVVGNWGHFCVPDIFVAQGLAWVHDYETISMVGLDLKSGEVKKKHSTEKWFKQGHHHRCYRNKATERYILTSYRGVEFLDLETGSMAPHHWSRGGCRYGIVPCNGLLYATPHPCECYIAAKLNGLYALAPQTRAQADKNAPGHPLEKGPAYAKSVNRQSLTVNPNDWPTYRHDAKRSGSTPSAMPTALEAKWKAEIGGRLSPPVVANGKLYVSAIDAQTVHALDAVTGKRVWSRSLAGRVDSPPTVSGDAVLFGCTDGWVYCLRAADGEMAWRLRAAPEERKVVIFGRLESAWPVHGSVLVKDGVVHLAAGRSSYLDGGIHVLSADIGTGKLLSQKCIYTPDPETHQQPAQTSSQALPGALADILVAGEDGIFMRQLRVDGEGKVSTPHLLTTAGFLDDSWFDRTPWRYGNGAANVLAFNDETFYGVRAYPQFNRGPFFYVADKGYDLFAGKARPPASSKTDSKNKKKKSNKPKDLWCIKVPIRAGSLLLAGERLFIAGPPDTTDEKDPWAAFDGRKGGHLWIVSSADGKKVGEYKLKSPPVTDGLIGANGKLYLSAVDGSVICLDGK